jgi:hypothetical protein
MRNIDPIVTRLKDFVDAVPSGEEDNVNWKELGELRHAAEMSLDELSKTTGGDPGEEEMDPSADSLLGCEGILPTIIGDNCEGMLPTII